MKLSKKHGLNPSLSHCEWCGKEIGIILFGALKGDLEAPRKVAEGLCDECETKRKEQEKVVKEGGILWKCSNCKSGGAIRVSETSKDLIEEVRKTAGIPEGPCGIEWKSCPVCKKEN